MEKLMVFSHRRVVEIDPKHMEEYIRLCCLQQLIS